VSEDLKTLPKDLPVPVDEGAASNISNERFEIFRSALKSDKPA